MTILFLLAFLIGAVAGLRAMTAPAAVAWAAHLGWVDLAASPLAFLGWTWTPWVFTVLALVEFVTDQLPATPSRTVPMQFGARIVSGALCGAALGAAGGNLWAGAALGVVGAVIGTLGGRAGRGALADAFGRDPPAAFIEDAVTVVAAVVIVLAAR